MGVNLVVDVESSDKVRFNDVPSSSLAHIRPLRQGMYVVHGTWLGRVHDVLDNVHVQFDDGSICKVRLTLPASPLLSAHPIAT